MATWASAEPLPTMPRVSNAIRLYRCLLGEDRNRAEPTPPC